MFNPYSQWLGLPPEIERPNYFQMLRISSKVVDPAEIAKAAQVATVKVRGAKAGEHALEWTQLIDEIETARKILSAPETRKAYIKRLLAEKKAREEAEAAAEAVTETPAGADSATPEFEEDEPEELEDDDPMAAWSAAYGGGTSAKTAAGPKARVAKGPAIGVPAKAGGPVAIKKAIKTRKKPGAAAYAVMGLLFLIAVAVAAAGGAYGLQMFQKPTSEPGPGPGQVAVVTPVDPNAGKMKPPAAPTPDATQVALAPEKMTPAVEDGGMEEEPSPMSEQDPEMVAVEPEPPAPPTSPDPFAPPTADPELAASAAPDDPFFVEPTLAKFGYAYDPAAATAEAAMAPTEAPMGRELTEEEKEEVNAALTEVRGLLGRREVPAAEKRIADLASKFEGTHASAKIESVSLLTAKFREFWLAVVRGADRTPKGAPLQYGEISFALVESTPQEFVVRTAGENKRWNVRTLPGGLAKFFAEASLNVDSPEAKVIIGTIYVLESGGAKSDQAMEFWNDAALEGEQETVSKLLPLLSPAGWKVS